MSVPQYAPVVVPRATLPHPASWLTLAIAAVTGTLVLTPFLAIAWYLWGFTVALVAWAAWLVLAAPFAGRTLANSLGRSLAGWRNPDPHEAVVLRDALIRVCVAAGEDPGNFAMRVGRGEYNAYSSGRNVLAATPDVLSGPGALESVELEAILAHEMGHHRHNDLLLAGPEWWFLLPLGIVDAVLGAVRRIPIVGRWLAAVLVIPFLLLLYPLRVLSCVASRPRELLADRFAVDCGYGRPLEEFLSRSRSAGWSGAGGLFGWMLDTHPSSPDRIAQIQDADALPEGLA